MFTPHGMQLDIQQVHASKWDAPSGYVKPSEWLNEWTFNEPTPMNGPESYAINFMVQTAR